MSRTLKNKSEKGGQKKNDGDKFIPKGIMIMNGKQELFVKKEFVAGFVCSKDGKPLDQKTFHQIIPKVKDSGIRLLGPQPHKMGRNNAARFEDFIRDNGLKKSANYVIKEVVKEEVKAPVSKKLQPEFC